MLMTWMFRNTVVWSTFILASSREIRLGFSSISFQNFVVNYGFESIPRLISEWLISGTKLLKPTYSSFVYSTLIVYFVFMLRAALFPSLNSYHHISPVLIL